MPTFAYAFVWVDDVLKAVEFYERAFGLQRRFARENGPLGWYAELETGATTLAIADSKEALAILPPGTHRNVASEPPGAFQVSFLSPDVDGTYRSALEAGGTGLMAPTLQPWGQTVARLRDPQGVLVSIASPLPPAG